MPRSPAKRWSASDLASLPGAEGLSLEKKRKLADRTRMLANRPMHTTGKNWDNFTEEEREQIRRARFWYAGSPEGGVYVPGQATSLKRRIESDWGAVDFQRPDGSDDLPALHAYAVASGQRNGSLKDPYSFASQRKALFGKDRDELSGVELATLDAVAGRLAQTFPGWAAKQDPKNIVWDESFDLKAAAETFFGTTLPGIAAKRSEALGKVGDWLTETFNKIREKDLQPAAAIFFGTTLPGNAAKITEALTKVLRETNGNQLQTARLLGINRYTLRAKIREYKIT